jgi:hypothetical protein
MRMQVLRLTFAHLKDFDGYEGTPLEGRKARKACKGALLLDNGDAETKESGDIEMTPAPRPRVTFDGESEDEGEGEGDVGMPTLSFDNEGRPDEPEAQQVHIQRLHRLATPCNWLVQA